MPRKIIVDCDPGQDDAVALTLAHGSPEIELVAITTVAGNQTLDKTTYNARRIATAAGIRGVPIAAGCATPLLRDLVTAGGIHGETGLDGAAWPEPDVPLVPDHAADVIVETVMASPGEITLVPIGPLTNVALAVRREPRIAERVREVVLMGGSATRGNSTPAAEFNMLVDPEAAAIVFAAGWPLTMVGLDLTQQAEATDAVMRRIRGAGGPTATLLADALGFYQARYRAEGRNRPVPVHDPCAVARVIRPELVQCVDARVEIETSGRWTSGMTVTDFRPDGAPCNARVAMRLDRDGFWDLVVDALERIGSGGR
jgi:purine nucleosidase